MQTTSMRVTFSKEFPGLGERIKECRLGLEKKKPLTRLAADAGISVPHWHRIEKGKIGDLPVETLRGIEKSLGINLGVQEDASN